MSEILLCPLIPLVVWGAGDATVSGSLHGGPHGQVGSSSGGNSGDFEDPVTSPNDPLFMFHHANVDRSMRWWMLKNAAKHSTFYGFPAANAEGIRENTGKSYYGQNLPDVMSSTWGFTAADLGFSSASGFQTNADLLCHNGPSASAHTYDTEVACSGSLETVQPARRFGATPRRHRPGRQRPGATLATRATDGT